MKQAFRLMVGLLVLWASVLHAEVRIVITQGVDSARPIGVVPFKWMGPGAAPENIGGIIAADLRNSGKFNPIDASRMPQQPSTAAEVTPAAWTALGIDAVVVGQVQPGADGSYLVSYQLVDTSGNPGSVLAQNQYKVTKQWLRYAAHTASDEVFEKLTGIKGAFRTRIAYVVQTNGGQFPYELRVADYDGYNQFVVHRSAEPLMSPAWSPDGSKLAFALSKTGSLNLYVMDLASGAIRQVTDGRSNNTEPTWFPDSQNLAFTSDQAGRPQIYKMNINGGAAQRLTWEGSQNQDAEVSPDGKFLVMVSSNAGAQHIAKLDLGTNATQVLTDTFLDETPSIAPNGTMVIYSSTQGLGSVLQLVSIDGRFKARLPATDGQVKFPAWSPYL
ncbi:translocation protein [Edwardsiella piscicida]|uniref:Tol-Pal system protein TolB n=1 Tax=Edwardsiella piscicida TaxID=1263550 RepID=UPI000D7041A6|nr:Tol-Pal system beta propeller repeat protein TolB [Edwardsiella piscicida]GBK59840.1 translocation protein [Edwardsiella piscicida]